MSGDKKLAVYPDFLAQRYTLLRELGQGAYGIVRYLFHSRIEFEGVLEIGGTLEKLQLADRV